MSNTYSEFLPSYSVGVDCYKAIPKIVKPYGKKAVAVGGKTAMEKSKKALTLKSLILYGTAVTPAMKMLKK